MLLVLPYQISGLGVAGTAGEVAQKLGRVWPSVYLSPDLVPAGVRRKDFPAQNLFFTFRSFPLHPGHSFLFPHSHKTLSFMVNPKGHVLQPDLGLSTASYWSQQTVRSVSSHRVSHLVQFAGSNSLLGFPKPLWKVFKDKYTLSD